MAILADVKDITSKLKSTEGQLGGLGKSASKVGQAVKVGFAVAAAGGIAVMVSKFKEAYDAVKLQEQLMSQTNAVLKSTGGAAHVSAKGVKSLADAIESKSTIDSEAIQSGENLLLTFTNIKNAAGKGNDVFNQTTQIMADMSTAMGSDPKTAAIQLGKALNDPIKGISALSKVGVSFTDQQKAQIKALQDSGNTMGAQKVILKELSKEFGGSAAAASNTFAGKMKHLKDSLDDVFEGIVKKVIPILSDLVDWLSKELPKALAEVQPHLQDMVTIFKDDIQPVLETVFNFLKNNKPVVIAFAAVLGVAALAAGTLAVVTGALNAVLLANPIILMGVALAALAAGLTYAYTKSDTFRAIVDKSFAAIKAITLVVFPVIKTVIVTTLKVIWTVISTYFNIYKTIISTVWKVVKAVTVGTFQGIKSAVTGPLSAVVSFIAGVPGRIKALGSKFKDAGSSIMNKIIDGIKSAAGFIGKIASGIWNAVKGLLNQAIDKINAALEFKVSLPLGKSISINPPNIPHLASGGITTGPTLALIGDNPGGREAVIPLDKYNGFGNTYYITVQTGPVANPVQIGKEIKSYIDAAEKAGARRSA